MSLEVEVAAAAVGDVRVQLGRRQIGVPEHFLDAAQVGAALEQVGRERVPQQVRVHPFRLEPRFGGELAQDEEGAGACERAALSVQEELGTVAPVEIGTPA
jgi:hypothetical protein